MFRCRAKLQYSRFSSDGISIRLWPINPVPTTTPTPAPTATPHSSPVAYFNSDRPSDNDTFPDTDAVSDTDALADGYPHDHSKSLCQRQSQINPYAHSAYSSPPSSPSPRQCHVVTQLIITPGRARFLFALRVLRVGMNTEPQFLTGKISPY
jgi:hypothetical protein